jgi:hypothetical protein
MLGSFDRTTGFEQLRSLPERVVVHDATPAVLAARSVGLRVDVAAAPDDTRAPVIRSTAPISLTNRVERPWPCEPLPVTRASLSSGAVDAHRRGHTVKARFTARDCV